MKRLLKTALGWAIVATPLFTTAAHAALGVCDAAPAGNVEVEATAGTAGPTGYATLKAAFDAINAGTHQGAIAIEVCGDTTEAASAALFASGGASSYTSVSIKPVGGAMRTISGSLAAPLVDFSGATNVTIDGVRASGNALTLSNTSTASTAGTSTIRFISGASNDTVTRATVLGSSLVPVTTTGGTISFSTDAISTGNSNNTISSNDVGPAGTSLPIKAISGVGTATAAAANRGVVIDGNKIFDFFGTGGSSVTGVYVGTGNDNWTISNNRIYQTAPRAFTGAGLRYSGITLSASATLGAFNVTGNTIGFGAADGTGTTTIGGSSNEVRGIDATTVNTTTPTSIQGNVVSGINQTTTRGSTTTTSSAFIGIMAGSSDGRYNVGNVTGNRIGSLDGSSTIVINHNGTAAGTVPVYGIHDFSNQSNTISNNAIGAITIQGTGTVEGFRGIAWNTGAALTETVANNTIGGSPAGAILDNQVGSYAMYGLQGTSATANLTGNVISHLSGKSTSASTGIITVAGFVIGSTSTTMASTISRNTVRALSNDAGASTFGGSIYGMSLTLPATLPNVVERNLLQTFNVISTASGNQLAGIVVSQGSTTYRNNMVSLGLDVAGNPITSGIAILGLFDAAAANVSNFQFNTVLIDGAGVSGTASSYALYSAALNNARAFQNNVLWNRRSNATAGGFAHAAMRLGATTTGLTSNYNDLYAPGTDGVVGVFNATAYPTLTSWQGATTQDAMSLSVDPLLVSAADLHLQAGSPMVAMGTAIAGITDDFDGDPRPAANPAIGADELSGQLAIAPAVRDFGNQTVGTTSTPASVTLSNAGAGTIGVSALTAAASPFAQSGGSCGAVPFSIAAGASCTLDYQFAPTLAGAATQAFTVTTTTGSAGFQLSGTGIATVTHTVTASVGTGSGTISPSGAQVVNDGATQVFTLTPSSGFHVGTVGGTCPAGTLSGNNYTTGAITTDCTVIANFAADTVTHTVTPSVGTGTGTISPNTPQTVNHGATTSFTLTAGSGFHVDTVGGTCGGALAGNVYTTNAVNADCTVIANFAADSGGSDLVCSGAVNHTTLANGNGSYYNWITGAIVDDGTGPATYHFNPYGTSKLAFFWGSNTKNAGVATSATGTTWKVLQVGDSVGPSAIFSRATGNATNWITGDTDGYLGFSMDCSTLSPAPASGTCYGYAHITATGTTGIPSKVVDYCYNKAGNPVTVAGAGNVAPSVSKAFAPATVLVNSNSIATITLTNTNGTAITLSADLVDTLPSGLVASAASTTCTGTASFTAGTLKLAAGATIPANGSCTLSGTMQSATIGSYVNTIAAGALQTSAGNNAAAASATLSVVPPTLQPPTIAKAFSPASVAVNTSSTATITLSNPNASAITLSADLVDTLPSGLVASAATTTCGGSASFTAGTLKLASGATIAAGASCTLTGTVQSATVGSYVNTIAAGGLQTNAGNNAAAATATLTVTQPPFPAPYCSVAFPSSIEPISRVKFTGIDNSSSPTVGASPALENFLSVAGGAVSRGGVYSMAVEGNTDGNFTTKVKAYIDWNQNGTFDADEGYVIGDLANSTGADGKQAVADITVPTTALLGQTRMRVIKRFSTAPDACNNGGYGQAEDYTITVDNNPLPKPIASVGPISLSISAEQGASGTQTMTVTNSGPGRLTFNIQRALAEAVANPEATSKQRVEGSERRLNDIAKAQLSGETGTYGRSEGKSPVRASHPFQLLNSQIAQMTDNTPVSQNGLACGNSSAGTTSDNSWWRRFYFSEHPGVGATALINSVTVASESGPSVPVTVNVYSIPHGVPANTIPTAQLTLIGSGTGTVGGTLTTSTIAIDAGAAIYDTAANDLVVEYHINGSSGSFYPGGNPTTQTHSTFLSSTACGIADPTDAANVGSGFPDFHIIMVVDVSDAPPPGTGCGSPTTVAWLSATPNTGLIDGIGNKDVTVKANAAGMAVGNYNALLCVKTNDATHPRFDIPVALAVTPSIALDRIFKDDFEGVQTDPDVVLGTINQPVQPDGDGSTLDFVSGLWGTYDATRNDNINLYDYGDGTLTVYWYGDVATVSVGGVVDSGGAEFAVLQSGATIGPGSTILATSKKLVNWTSGVDGYIGVAFENAQTGALNYGYIHLKTMAPLGFPAQALEYAYNKAGIAITIP